MFASWLGALAVWLAAVLLLMLGWLAVWQGFNDPKELPRFDIPRLRRQYKAICVRLLVLDLDFCIRLIILEFMHYTYCIRLIVLHLLYSTYCMRRIT